MGVTHKKQVLLAITGLSPQIVTETLYGIHQQGLAWPDEIQILTTKKGKKQAELGLITTSPQLDGRTRLEQLCHDYDRPVPLLTAEQILVVPDANGDEVDDARTLEDQEALADFIVQQVATLCADPSINIHASLAGGRKTMTFYLGYAMTLFARADDRLSHVLVDADYEGLSDFYYPTPYTLSIKGRSNNELHDASKAKVMLSEIPFIRQRSQLSKEMLGYFEPPKAKHADENFTPPSYRELVRYQNMAADLQGLGLSFDLANSTVDVLHNNELLKRVDFSGAPLELAFYAMMARHSQLDNPIKLSRPSKDYKERYHGYLFVRELEAIAGYTPTQFKEGGELSAYQAYFDGLHERLPDQVRTLSAFADSHLSAEALEAQGVGMGGGFFDDRKGKLNELLLRHFPGAFVDCIKPEAVFAKDKKSKEYTQCQFGGKGGQHSAWGLWLEPSNIHFC